MKIMKFFAILCCLAVLTHCASLGLYNSAERAFQEGKALFNRGQYQEAIPYFEKTVDLDPDYGEAYLFLGRSYLNLGRWQEAISPLRTALRLAPAETRKETMNILIDALFGAGMEGLKKGEFRSAIDYFQQILTLKPSFHKVQKNLFEAWMGLGKETLAGGDPAAAVKAFSEALQLSPGSVNAYLELAKAFFQHGDYLKSMQTLKDLLQIDPTNDKARSVLRQLMNR
jgi:tetratricopeptide (TPR) repeat protein